ncbi:hypothetical protein JCM10207_008163 [Rhodosporidiobolus poonsookiae]
MTSERVLQIVRDRLESGLAFKGGFGEHHSGLVRLGKVELDGVELDGDDDTKAVRGAQAVVECLLMVAESCCNYTGNAHGGFLAWLIDHCSSLSLIALATGGRWVTSGVSTNLNISFIAAAPVGREIRIVSSVLQLGKTAGLLEIRVEDVVTGMLLCFATHNKQDVSARAKL